MSRVAPVLALIFALSACVSVDRTVLMPGLAPVPVESVRVFLPNESPPEHARVAILEAGSNDQMNSTADILNKLRAEAASLGADAVWIVGSESENASTRALRTSYSGVYLGGRQKTLALAIRRIKR